MAKPVDPGREFIDLPDRDRLLQAIVELGTQAELFFNEPQDIEGSLKKAPGPSGKWTITLLQSRRLPKPAGVFRQIWQGAGIAVGVTAFDRRLAGSA